jgi:hypothetical protein
VQSQVFARALRGFSRRIPFHKFTVELVSGTRFTVQHPEALVFRGGTAVYIAPDGNLTIFEHEGVNQLSDVNGQRSRRR